MSSNKGLTGGRVNYYLADVQHPQREDQIPYRAECEDIAEALQLTPNEFCEFKALWRTAAARLGNGKPDQKALYDAEKRVHYAQRDVLKYKREAGIDTTPKWTIDGDSFLRIVSGLLSNRLMATLSEPGARPPYYKLPLETFHLGSSDVHVWPVDGKPDPTLS